MSAWLADRYWLGWAVFVLVSFLVPEVYSLVVRKPQGTLSDTVWRLENMRPDGTFGPWTAAHFFFIGVLVMLVVFLICHFGWGLFR